MDKIKKEIWFDDATVEAAKEFTWWHNIQFQPGVFAHHWAKHQCNQIFWDQTVRVDPENMDVLDLGAYDGGYSVEALRRGARSVDMADRILFPTRQLLRQTVLKKSKEINSEFSESTWPQELNGKKYDLVLGLGILYHIKDIPNFLHGLKNTLKPNGIVAFETDITFNDQPVVDVSATTGSKVGLRKPDGTVKYHSWFPGHKVRVFGGAAWEFNEDYIFDVVKRAGFTTSRIWPDDIRTSGKYRMAFHSQIANV